MSYNQEFMQIAIDEANKCLNNEGCGPFGACIVKDNKLVSVGNNMVVCGDDPTAHAEIVAIRNACKELKTYNLLGCELYSSCQPCPMCLSACYWAGISKVYYAATKEDASSYGFIDGDLYSYFKGDKTQKLNNMEIEKVDFMEAISTFENYKGKIY